MKRFTSSLLLPLLALLLACKKPADPAVSIVVTPPVSTTTPVSNTSPVSTTTPATSSTVVWGQAPYDVDLFSQFAQPFPASSTQRLREITIYNGTKVVAQSSFSYDEIGRLTAQKFTKGLTQGPYAQKFIYAYDTNNRRVREEAYSLSENGAVNDPPYAITDYTYVDGLLTIAARKSKVSFYPLSLATKTTYQYAGGLLTKGMFLNYYSTGCVCNVPSPLDSTRQVLILNGKTTSRIDSTWHICYPGSSCQTSLQLRIVTQTERDDKGNVIMLTVDSKPQSSNTETIKTYKYIHQYNGPDGLLSTSTSEGFGLRYEFIYESK